MNDILIAKIVAPFGIKGGLKLLIFSDNLKTFSKYQLHDRNQQPIKFTYNISSAKNTSSGMVLIAFSEGVSDRNLAEQMVGAEFFINKNSLPKPKKTNFILKV